MPNAAFAAGILGGYADQFLAERDRRDRNNLAAANYLLQTGRVKDLNELTPLIGSMLTPGGMPMKSAGRGKSAGASGKGGPQDPTSILAMLMNPALQASAKAQEGGRTLGGQPRPSFPAADGGAAPQAQPQASRALLYTEDEAAQRAQDQQIGLERRRQEEITGPEERKREAARLEVAKANIAGRQGPGTLQGRVNAAFDAFVEKNGREPSAEEATQIIDGARKAWQTAGQKPTDFQSAIKTAETDKGGPLTLGEVLKIRKQWSNTASPAERLAMQKAMADYRYAQGELHADDVLPITQAVTLGDNDRRGYIDMSNFKSAKDATAARRIAIANGIVPLQSKQVEQMEAGGSAKDNLKGFEQTIRGKLSPDAAGRPLTAIENKLSQYFQTDEDLAAAVSWDTSVLPFIRSLAVGQRITNLEFQRALNSRPKITDTVGTAAKKMANLQTILDNGMKQVLDRGVDGGAPKPAGGGGADNGGSLKLRARQHLLDAQKSGKIPKDVTIDDAAVDKWLKANPTFK